MAISLHLFYKISLEMTYITIDTNKKQALLFLDYVKTLSFVTVHQEPNEITLNAIDEVKKGKLKKHKNSKDLISLLNK
ncbi:MAG: hypothetical protein EBZ58_03195 [Bacteroidetes bacterium]|nr:hypothetical protein [Bacteroidota bacterium]